MRQTMELPRKHHYKPMFFLGRWAGKDGRLCEMKFIEDKNKIVPRRRHPAGTGYVKDLYRTDGVPEEISQALETNFMSPLDNAAANALGKIVPLMRTNASLGRGSCCRCSIEIARP
jgi:hypothetical protein